MVDSKLKTVCACLTFTFRQAAFCIESGNDTTVVGGLGLVEGGGA